MRKITACLLSVAMLSSSLVGVAAAHAQTAQGMEDLIGVRGSSAESELDRRGYKFVKNWDAAALWWNNSRKSCVSVTVENGRIDSIQSGTPADCGKSGGGGNTAAGIVAGAAAVGLIAALSSHHKKTDDRNNSPTYNSEYQRGYHDAMYGSHYATDDSEAYHSGFMAGEAERSNRRHANSAIARGLPGAAGNACISKGEYEWGVPGGSVSVVNSSSYAPGNYEVTLATGHWRAMCRVTVNGQVTKFKPL